MQLKAFIQIYCIAIVPFYLSAQEGVNLKNNNVEKNYEEWLTASTLGRLLEVDKLEKTDFNSRLVLSSVQEEADQFAQLWFAVNDSLKPYRTDLSQILMHRFAKLSGLKTDQCMISINTPNNTIFSAKISSSSGKIISEIHHINVRSYFVFPEFSITSMLPKPDGKIDCPHTLNECRSKVKELVEKYIGEKNGEPVSMHEVKVNDFFYRYDLDNLRELITDRFQERLEFEFSFEPLNDRFHQVEYEISGWYASGIGSTGNFHDMRADFYSRLVRFSEPIEDYVESSIN